MDHNDTHNTHPALPQMLEAILFFKNEPLSLRTLAGYTGASETDVRSALETLKGLLAGRGIVLLQNGDEVMLGTAPEVAGLIEKLIKEDLNKDIGKAGLETLAIVLYLGPLPRARIDYIRGVNSTFILRALAVRGLVEKTANPNDQRSVLYQPTFALLSHLGVARVEDLPEYERVRSDIAAFEETNTEEKTPDTAHE